MSISPISGLSDTDEENRCIYSDLEAIAHLDCQQTGLASGNVANIEYDSDSDSVAMFDHGENVSELTALGVDREASLEAGDDCVTESCSISSHSLQQEQSQQVREARPSNDVVDLTSMHAQAADLSQVTLTISAVEGRLVDSTSEDTNRGGRTSDEVLSGGERNFARTCWARENDPLLLSHSRCCRTTL